MTNPFPHIKRNRAFYFFLPISALLIFGASSLYRLQSGRWPIDEGSMTGVAENFTILVLAWWFTRLAKPQLFTELSDDETKTLPWQRVVIDSCETLALFSLALWSLRH